jgi:hypothetical protein
MVFQRRRRLDIDGPFIRSASGSSAVLG